MCSSTYRSATFLLSTKETEPLQPWFCGRIGWPINAAPWKSTAMDESADFSRHEFPLSFLFPRQLSCSPAFRYWSRGSSTTWRRMMPCESSAPVSYTHLRAHETPEHLVCRLLLEK